MTNNDKWVLPIFTWTPTASYTYNSVFSYEVAYTLSSDLRGGVIPKSVDAKFSMVYIHWYKCTPHISQGSS